MKKILLLITIAFAYSSSLFAQELKRENTLDLAARMKKTSAASKLNTSNINNLPNGTFETWVVDSIESFSGNTIRFVHPEMWAPINGIFIAYFLGLDLPISAVLNGNNSAAKIEIGDMDFGCDLGTVTATNSRPISLKGEYQFNGADQSSAYFEVIATKFNPQADSSEIVGSGYVEIIDNTSGSYVSFDAPLNYIDPTIVPDSIYVFATYLQGEFGTWFKFDNLSLDYTSTGIHSERANELQVYPNPSKDQIKISLNNNTKLENATVEIRSIDGSLKLKLTNYQSNESIDISALSNGLYILNVQDATGVVSKKINKI